MEPYQPSQRVCVHLESGYRVEFPVGDWREMLRVVRRERALSPLARIDTFDEGGWPVECER